MSNWDYILSTSQKGWECPRCGRILAPWMSYCICNKSTTYTTAPRTVDTTSIASTAGDLKRRYNNCNNCKYTNLSFNEYPCSICTSYDMFKPVDSEK